VTDPSRHWIGFTSAIRAERKVREIRVRAERRAGELVKLSQQNGEVTHGGDRESRSRRTTLKDVEISRDQSSKWQQLAAVPEEQFEKLVAEPHMSTEGIIAAAKPMYPQGGKGEPREGLTLPARSWRVVSPARFTPQPWPACPT